MRVEGKLAKKLDIPYGKIFRFYKIQFPNREKFHIFCPFHKETQPSFYVTMDTNFAYCFACNKGFDPLGFVREKERCSFFEAMKKLAEIGGFQLSDSEIADYLRSTKDGREKFLFDEESKVIERMIHKISQDFLKLIAPYKHRREWFHFLMSAWTEFDCIWMDNEFKASRKALDQFKDWYYRWSRWVKQTAVILGKYPAFVRDSYEERIGERLKDS